MQNLPHVAPSRQQLTDTSNALNARAEKRAEAAKYAKLLLGCYRTGDANDPEVYTAAVIAVLADYPSDVMAEVTDPRSGLPGKVRWLPTVQEIRVACEEIHGRREQMRQWQAAAQKQLAERERIDAERQNRPEHVDLPPSLRREPHVALPAEKLWQRWREHRLMRGVHLSAEARAVLVGAGYDPDGPDGQQPAARPSQEAA